MFIQAEISFIKPCNCTELHFGLCFGFPVLYEGRLFLTLRQQSSTLVLTPLLAETYFSPKEMQNTGKLIGQIITLAFVWFFFFFLFLPEIKGFKSILLHDKYPPVSTTMSWGKSLFDGTSYCST